MSNNSLPCSKCRGQHHPADECVNTPEISQEIMLEAELLYKEIKYAENKLQSKWQSPVHPIVEFIIKDRARGVVSIDLDAPIDEEAVKATKDLFDESLRRAGRKD